MNIYTTRRQDSDRDEFGARRSELERWRKRCAPFMLLLFRLFFLLRLLPFRSTLVIVYFKRVFFLNINYFFKIFPRKKNRCWAIAPPSSNLNKSVQYFRRNAIVRVEAKSPGNAAAYVMWWVHLQLTWKAARHTHTHTHGARRCEDLAQKLIYSGMLMQSAMFLFFPSQKIKGKKEKQGNLFFFFISHLIWEEEEAPGEGRENARKC